MAGNGLAPDALVAPVAGATLPCTKPLGAVPADNEVAVCEFEGSPELGPVEEMLIGGTGTLARGAPVGSRT